MITLAAPAKINWSLRVMGRRDDGFHEIESLMQCITLCDTLSFEPSDSITVHTRAEIPEEDNLVQKAAVLLQEETGTTLGARITLEKKIPMEAGLGGGSSDAAATLKGLSELWGIDVPQEKLMEIGARLGSDVPFFLQNTPAVVSGRGENIAPATIKRSYELVLVKPPLGVRAGWAYSMLQTYSNSDMDTEGFIEALDSGDTEGISRMLVNDLEGPVLAKHPVLAEIKGALLEAGAFAALMSGSGSTVFGVFEGSQSREKAAQALGEMYGTDYLVVKAETISS